MRFCEILCGSTGLTHTVTHTAKCPERDRERQTGSFAFLLQSLGLHYIICYILFGYF